MRHLRFKHALQAVVAQKFRAETIKVELAARGIERREKGNALDVVPMVVRDEDMRFQGRVCRLRGPSSAQHAQPGAAVQNERRAVRQSAVRGTACCRRNAMSRGPPSASSPARPRSSTELCCPPLPQGTQDRVVSLALTRFAEYWVGNARERVLSMVGSMLT